MSLQVINNQGYTLKLDANGPELRADIVDDWGHQVPFLQGRVKICLPNLTPEEQSMGSSDAVLRKRLQYFAKFNYDRGFYLYKNKKNPAASVLVIGHNASGLPAGGRDDDMVLSSATLVGSLAIGAFAISNPFGWAALATAVVAGGAGGRVMYCWDKTDDNPNADKKYNSEKANREMFKGAAKGGAGAAVGAVFMPEPGTVLTFGDKVFTAGFAGFTGTSASKIVHNNMLEEGEREEEFTLGEMGATIVTAPINVFIGGKATDAVKDYTKNGITTVADLVWARGAGGALAGGLTSAADTVTRNVMTSNKNGLTDGLGAALYVGILTGGIKDAGKAYQDVQKQIQAIEKQLQEEADTSVIKAVEDESLALQAYQDEVAALRAEIQAKWNKGYRPSDPKLDSVDKILQQIAEYGHEINMKDGKGKSHGVMKGGNAFSKAKASLENAQAKEAQAKAAAADPTNLGLQQAVKALENLQWEVNKLRKEVRKNVRYGFKSEKWGTDVDKIVEQAEMGHTVSMKKNGEPNRYVRASKDLRAAQSAYREAQELGVAAKITDPILKQSQLFFNGEMAKLRKQVCHLLDQRYKNKNEEVAGMVDAIMNELMEGKTVTFERHGEVRELKLPTGVRLAKTLNVPAGEAQSQAQAWLQQAQHAHSMQRNAIKTRIESLLRQDCTVWDENGVQQEMTADEVFRAVVGEGKFFTLKNQHGEHKIGRTDGFFESASDIKVAQEAVDLAGITDPVRRQQMLQYCSEVCHLRDEIKQLFAEKYHRPGHKDNRDIEATVEEALRKREAVLQCKEGKVKKGRSPYLEIFARHGRSVEQAVENLKCEQARLNQEIAAFEEYLKGHLKRGSIFVKLGGEQVDKDCSYQQIREWLLEGGVVHIPKRYGSGTKSLRTPDSLRQAQQAVRYARDSVRIAQEGSVPSPYQQKLRWAQLKYDQAVAEFVADIQQKLNEGFQISKKSLQGSAAIIAEQVIKYDHRVRMKNPKTGEAVTLSFEDLKLPFHDLQLYRENQRTFLERHGGICPEFSRVHAAFTAEFDRLTQKVMDLSAKDGYRKWGSEEPISEWRARNLVEMAIRGRESVTLYGPNDNKFELEIPKSVIALYVEYLNAPLVGGNSVADNPNVKGKENV